MDAKLLKKKKLQERVERKQKVGKILVELSVLLGAFRRFLAKSQYQKGRWLVWSIATATPKAVVLLWSNRL